MGLGGQLAYLRRHLSRPALGDVLRGTGGDFEVFDGDVVGVGVASLGFRQDAHADAVGGRLGTVLDHPLFQADAFIATVLEEQIGVVGLFTHGRVDDFFQVAVTDAKVTIEKRLGWYRSICATRRPSS